MERLQIEEQVCTVEQSKRLVELGATSDSHTCWIRDEMNPHWNNGYGLSRLGYEAMQLLRRCEEPEASPRPKRNKALALLQPLTEMPPVQKELWPAYSVAELLSLVVKGDYYATFFACGKWHFIDLKNEDAYRVAQSKSGRPGYLTEAQARAAMAIEILEFSALKDCRVGHPMPYAIPV